METQSLYEVLYMFLDWHPARIKTFAELIWGVVKSKTVRIKELAIHVASNGDLHAKITKVERLFLLQPICCITIGKVIFKLLNQTAKVNIAIDRTNWQFGSNNLNFFVAAVIYGNISIPIAWLLLDKKGNSCTLERKKLIELILAIIPKTMIGAIVADREFIGEEWLTFLYFVQALPFAIRIKKNEQIKHRNGGKMTVDKYFMGMKMGEVKTIENELYKIPLKITCLQLEKEQLFIASNAFIGESALISYKQRWSIERTFKSMKTSGFNIEDTHMSDQKKLEKLFAIVSLSLAVCVIAGEIKNDICPIKIKKHGHKLYSLFTYGFDWLRDYFINSQKQQNCKLSSMFEILQYRFFKL